jgi:hypothetical protein
MHKNTTKSNETLSKWCKNKHGASKIIDTFEMYQGFTPFFWKQKGDDAGNDGPGKDNDGNDAPNREATLSSANMDVDKPQGGNSLSHGNSVALGPVMGASAHSIAVTPINLNPTNPRAKEIVEEFWSRLLGYIQALHLFAGPLCWQG